MLLTLLLSSTVAQSLVCPAIITRIRFSGGFTRLASLVGNTFAFMGTYSVM